MTSRRARRTAELKEVTMPPEVIVIPQTTSPALTGETSFAPTDVHIMNFQSGAEYLVAPSTSFNTDVDVSTSHFADTY